MTDPVTAELSAQGFERLERLGKHLFGVAFCVLLLPTVRHERNLNNAHAFFAGQPLPDMLQIEPQAAGPFQPALGRVDQSDIRFKLVQPLRDQAGCVIGAIALLHDRPRAFTPGDRVLLDDLLVLAERELHLSFSSSSDAASH